MGASQLPEGATMIEGYAVTLEQPVDVRADPREQELAEVIDVIERLYKVSYARYQYYADPKRLGWIYCGSDYMGRIVDVRASREYGAHQVFEAVPAMVKL